MDTEFKKNVLLEEWQGKVTAAVTYMHIYIYIYVCNNVNQYITARKWENAPTIPKGNSSNYSKSPIDNF